MTLREQLNEWCERDVAAHLLAVSLGLLNSEVDLSTRAKHVFWSDNLVGNALYQMLDSLCAAGVLECRDDEVRWNPSFRGSWEQG